MVTRIFVILLLVATLGGCKKKEATTATDSIPPPASSTNPPTTAQITSITMGKHADIDSKQVTEETSTFGVTDTINASVRTENAPQGTSITAKWYFTKTNQDVHEESTALSAGGNTTRFFIIPPKGSSWPTGDYKLEVTVPGSSKSVTFTVKK